MASEGCGSDRMLVCYLDQSDATDTKWVWGRNHGNFVYFFQNLMPYATDRNPSGSDRKFWFRCATDGETDTIEGCPEVRAPCDRSQVCLVSVAALSNAELSSEIVFRARFSKAKCV